MVTAAAPPFPQQHRCVLIYDVMAAPLILPHHAAHKPRLLTGVCIVLLLFHPRLCFFVVFSCFIVSVFFCVVSFFS